MGVELVVSIKHLGAWCLGSCMFVFFFQAEDGIRDYKVTGSSDVCSSDLSLVDSLLLLLVLHLNLFRMNYELLPMYLNFFSVDRKSVV